MLDQVQTEEDNVADIGEINMVAMTGCLGYGFTEQAFQRALDSGMDFIGCDAGSMDPGPYYLGEGIPFVSREASKRDLSIMLEGAIARGIPLLIGTSGGGGGKPHLAFTRQLVEEIAAEKGLHFKMALIHAELGQDYLLEKVRAGKVRPLGPIDDLTEKGVRETHRVVAMMGVEPYHEALKAGAQVILAGRSSDAAIYAAIPTMRGADPGLAWHLGKIIECAGAVVEPKIGQDCVIGRLHKSDFVVEPGHPDKCCPRIRIAAHTLYENPSPYHLVEPSGTLDTTGSTYEQIDPRSVKVAGSKMHKADVYTVKLEGVKRLGFRSMFIAGIRDPGLISQMDTYIATNTAKVAEEAAGMGIADSDYTLTYRVYGRNAVMGSLEPVKETQAHEVGLLVDCIAKDEDISRAILAKARYCCLHNDFPGRMCISGNLAFPFSPSDVSVGWVYSFHIWHVMELEDPLEPFPMELVEV
jgi:hypothetical protein